MSNAVQYPTPEQVRGWEDLYPRVWIGDLCRSWLALHEENEHQAAVLEQAREALEAQYGKDDPCRCHNCKPDFIPEAIRAIDTLKEAP